MEEASQVGETGVETGEVAESTEVEATTETVAETTSFVDEGSDLSSSLGLEYYTTNTDNREEYMDSGIVDIGFHYPHPLAYMDRGCSVCDLEKNGTVEFADLAIFAMSWLDTCAT